MTKEERVERLRALLAEGYTIASAARLMGIGRATAHDDAMEAGLRSSPEAIEAALRERSARLKERVWGEAAAKKHAAVLAKMEALRAPGVSIQKIVVELGVSDTLAGKIWAKAHPGESYFIPVARAKTRDAAYHRAQREKRKQQADQDADTGAEHGSVMRQRITEEYKLRAAIFQHSQRTRCLPPVQPDEVADLVAKFLTERGATVGPTVACAPVNNGRGF